MNTDEIENPTKSFISSEKGFKRAQWLIKRFIEKYEKDPIKANAFLSRKILSNQKRNTKDCYKWVAYYLTILLENFTEEFVNFKRKADNYGIFGDDVIID